MSADQIAALADRLEAIAEELADVAIDQLKSSLRRRSGHEADDGFDGGAPAAAIDERRVTRARRAVEKAVTLLRGADTGTGADD